LIFSVFIGLVFWVAANVLVGWWLSVSILKNISDLISCWLVVSPVILSPQASS